MDIEDKYNKTAQQSQQLLREEEDKTIFDEEDDDFVDESFNAYQARRAERWWSSSY